MSQNSLAEVAGAVRSHRRFLITTHLRPDGDACGSLLALRLMLLRLGAQVTATCHHPPPERFLFLEGSDAIVLPHELGEASDFDCAIAVDCDGIDRSGDVESLLRRISPLIDIDHHAGLKAFGDICVVRESAAATAELIFELAAELGLDLDPPIATCLLTGLTDDTGSFRHGNTSPRAHRIAAELVEAGAGPTVVAQNLYGDLPRARVLLHGRALGRSRYALGGSVVLTHVSQADFAETDASQPDVEGIIDTVRHVRGARVAVLMVELKSRETKVSLRSRDGTDVSRIASVFGGGGHREAAGCNIQGTPDHAEAPLLEAITAEWHRRED